MKITCNKNELTNALQIVARAVATKPQTPILSGYLSESRRHNHWSSKQQIMKLASLLASRQISRNRVN